MIYVQIAYLPGGTLAAAAPSRACLTMGIHILPAFLDYKMRTTPQDISADYYGLESDVDAKEVKKETVVDAADQA